MITNVGRQPQTVASQAMNGGESAPPTAAPVLKIPMPSARSRTGNHSAIAFAAPGQFPASPKPSTKRQDAKLVTVRAVAWAAAATDHTTIETAKPTRVPTASKSRPESIWLIAYAIRNAFWMAAYSGFVIPRSSLIDFFSTDTVWRST